MSAHALGPWSIHEWQMYDTDGALDACGAQVVDANGCMISAGHMEGESEEGIANTRLIAAAPDLLKALAMFVHPYQQGCKLTEMERMDFAKAAIVKATGETK